MSDQLKAERLVKLAHKLLDDLIALSAPQANECDLQIEMVVAIIKVAVGYGIAAQMPSSVMAGAVQVALNEVYDIAREQAEIRLHARQAQAQAQVPQAPVPEPVADRPIAPEPLTEAAALEVLARLKGGGNRVH